MAYRSNFSVKTLPASKRMEWPWTRTGSTMCREHRASTQYFYSYPTISYHGRPLAHRLAGAARRVPGAAQLRAEARKSTSPHRPARARRPAAAVRARWAAPPFAALWHARGVAARQATTCGTPAMRAVLDDLRGRRPGTHGEVWFPFEGGGFGNELNKYLAGCALAIALNRTARIVVGGAKTIGLFEPRLGDWRSDSAPSGENATTLDYRAAVACAPRACGARYVPLVLTNTKPQPPAENSDLARKVHAHIKRRASPPAWSDLLGCLTAEPLRPSAAASFSSERSGEMAAARTFGCVASAGSRWLYSRRHRCDFLDDRRKGQVWR